MKRFLISCAGALVLMGVSAFAAHAGDLIVGLSPDAASPEEARSQTVKLLQFLTGEIEPGEHARIIDARSTASICDFVVPDKPAYRHEKAKLTHNAACVGKLLKRAEFANQSAPVPYAISLPNFLRFVGENYPASQNADILIFGSPLFDDPREPSVSMAYGHVPGDGHLNAPRSASPFSAAPETLLSHMRLHIVAPDADWAINREHEYFVRRLWTLFVEKQGGSLVTFTSDSQSAFARIRDHANGAPQEFQLADTTKLEMIPIRRDTGARTPIHERPLALTPPALTELRSAANVEVGVTWDCKRCDLDLYARPWRGGEVLFFGHTNSPEGQFFKDFQQSPETSNGLESVEFNVPLDLNKLFVAINLYAGAPPSGAVTGDVRIAIGDRTYAAPFLLEASSGNQGAGASELFGADLPSSPGWVVIDIRKTLGLTQ